MYRAQHLASIAGAVRRGQAERMKKGERVRCGHTRQKRCSRFSPGEDASHQFRKEWLGHDLICEVTVPL